MENHGSNAAAEAVASSSDMLYEILFRLPPESLLTFKIVCRQWYHLISSHQFRLSSNPRITGMFVVTRKYDYEYVEFDNNYHVKTPSKCLCKFPRKVNILNSYNGLLLVCANFEKLFVCNPTTKQTRRIPNPIVRKSHFRTEPSYVLGFDHSIMPENYRIVFLHKAIEYESEAYEYYIDVYESETRAWRHSTTTCLISSSVRHPGVFWNGAAYWLDFSGEILVCFDIKQDCVGETLLPPIVPMFSKGDKMDLRPCQGHLYLFSIDLTTDFG